MPQCDQFTHVNNAKCVCLRHEGKPIREIRDADASVLFKEANLQDARIVDSKLSGDFSDCNMIRAELNGSSILNANVHGSQLTDVVIHDTNIVQTNLTDSELTRAQLSFVRIYDTSFATACWNSALVRNSEFVRCNFTNTSLKGARFESCYFNTIIMWRFLHSESNDSPFSNATFSKVYFNDANFGHRLVNAVFDRCTFNTLNTRAEGHIAAWNCRFSYCDMSKLNLTKFGFGRSSFDHSVLDDTNLQLADLTFCSLRNTSLRNCDLRCARLLGTDLRGADITGAKFRRARYDAQTVWPHGMSPPTEAMNLSEQNALKLELLSRSHEPTASDMDLLWATAGQPIVFTPAPHRSNAYDWVYEVYPELFTIKRDVWAIPFSQTAYGLREIVHGLAEGGLRVGDGVMPFQTKRDRLQCIATHMAESVPLSMLLANMETMSRSDALAWVENEIRKSVASTRRKARRNQQSTKKMPVDDCVSEETTDA